MYSYRNLDVQRKLLKRKPHHPLPRCWTHKEGSYRGRWLNAATTQETCTLYHRAWFESWLLHSLLTHLGHSKCWSKHVDSCAPCTFETQMDSWTLPGPAGCCRHLRNQSKDRTLSLCFRPFLSPSLCHFAFLNKQINKSLKQKDGSTWSFHWKK